MPYRIDNLDISIYIWTPTSVTFQLMLVYFSVKPDNVNDTVYKPMSRWLCQTVMTIPAS